MNHQHMYTAEYQSIVISDESSEFIVLLCFPTCCVSSSHLIIINGLETTTKRGGGYKERQREGEGREFIESERTSNVWSTET